MIDIQMDGNKEMPQNKDIGITKSNGSTQNKQNEHQQKITITKVIYKNLPPPSAAINSKTTPSMTGHRPRSGSAREQALHAVEYYNNNVLRARLGAGLAGPRNSVNERFLSSRNQQPTRYLNPSEHLYRSNSSLELITDQGVGVNQTNDQGNQNGTLGRQYGSHGSIDVISTPGVNNSTSESFYNMLQEYRPAVLKVANEKSEPIKPTTNGGYVSGKIQEFEQPLSPKLKHKFNRLWGQSHSSNHQQQKTSSTRQQNTLSISEDCSLISNTTATSSSSMNHSSLSTAATSSADIEERQRRRAFAHFDCQSLTANLGYAAKLRGLLLARRRNTTTGASAASMITARSATPDADSGDEDFGDGQGNELLENCPYFRNETGGEEEREVSLTRMHTNHKRNAMAAIHRPTLAYGVSILECIPNETLWRQTTCPFQKNTRPIESIDHGARYYRHYFAGQDHQNWFGMDEQLGPVAISIKREKLPEYHDQIPQHQFRMIIRTSELLTLRGSVVEDSIPNPRASSGKPVQTKEVLEYVAPEIQLGCLRLGVNSPQCEQQLMKLDEQGLTNKYKVGILYCKADQSSEEDMYNNEEAGPSFMEFLDTIGKRVRLKGFDHYKAGLDNKTDSTGSHSLYASYQDCEIMFHVSTMLPFTPNNRQQLLRKRHIGNDIVTIVFQEPGALPFTPKNIRSQFQHVFIIIRAINPCTENTSYRVAVSRSKEVPIFGPPIPAAMFNRNKQFADFLLAKVINAENAAHRSEKFATMATRTRQEYLKDLATNYCTSTLVEPTSKFSIFPSKKKEKTKPRFCGDAIQRAAFCWQVVLQDSGLSSAIDCFLGISTETFVLIEECSRQIVFVTPTKSILGWSANGNSLRIYHHQGECVTINMRDIGERDEQLEVIERLRAVSSGCGALELSLRRNPMGQLGFHVQPDGVVTQVETSGQAWVAGLRQGYRLVEICKIAVATLSHDQMVDLLKTSAQVQVTVIESFPDFSPRRGCYLQNCKFNILNFDSNEYESVTVTNHGESPSKNLIKKQSSAQQTSSSSHRRQYERNFSPPRSSNSSGYGTGSSSRSFSIPNEQNRTADNMGTLTSSSSGHSSNDDRWYDILENVVENHTTNQIKVEKSSTHQKLHTSSSLPLHSRPLSVHDPTKVVAGNERPSPRMANVEYLITKPPNNSSFYKEPIKEMKNLSMQPNSDLANSTLSENICQNTKDESEILDISPRLRRSATSTNLNNKGRSNGGGSIISSSSASSSRNNSPRPNSEALSAGSNGLVLNSAAKLRPGVTNNHHHHHHKNNSNMMQRNSVNYTGSSLQEDLMKLINPDYLSSDDSCIINYSVSNKNPIQLNSTKSITNSHSLGNISQLSGNLSTINSEEFILKNKSRSREAINLGNHLAADLSRNSEISEPIYSRTQNGSVHNDIITHNSSSHNGRQIEENVLHISEGSTPDFRKNVNLRKKYEHHVQSQPLPLLPDPNDMDWSTLVDTANRAAILLQQEDQNKLEKSHSQDSVIMAPSPLPVEHQYSSVGEKSVAPLPEIQNHLSQLEDRILKETRRRKSLEHAVRRLTEENRRLQDESQAAVQQLRRFTEWFFQTIDRQS